MSVLVYIKDETKRRSYQHSSLMSNLVRVRFVIAKFNHKKQHNYVQKGLIALLSISKHDWKHLKEHQSQTIDSCLLGIFSNNGNGSYWHASVIDMPETECKCTLRNGDPIIEFPIHKNCEWSVWNPYLQTYHQHILIQMVLYWISEVQNYITLKYSLIGHS